MGKIRRWWRRLVLRAAMNEAARIGDGEYMRKVQEELDKLG